MMGLMKKMPGWVLPAAAALVSGAAFAIYFQLLMRDAWILIIFAVFYLIYKTSFRMTDRLVLRSSRLCGALFALALSLARLEDISYHGTAALWFALMFAGLYLILSNVLSMIYIRAINVRLQSGEEGRDISGKRLAAVFFGALVIIELCYLPAYLHSFPGKLNPDSYWQLRQAAGLDPLTTHSPLAHTLVIKLFYDMGLALFGGDQTRAVALYTAVQSVMLAAAFAYTVETMYKLGVKGWVIATVLAVYALSPYHGGYSVTMWKDVWFAGAMLALLTTVWRMLRHRERNEAPPVHELALLFVFTAASCLFRNAAVYVLALFAVLVFAVFIKKTPGGRRYAAVPLTVLLAVLLAYGTEGPLYSALGIRGFGIQESLSIPIQQVARTVCDGGELTEEQEELLGQVVDVAEIPQTYMPRISDPMKDLIHDSTYISGNKAEFLKLWLELGRKYPASYLNAWIDQTIGYWYPPVAYYVTLGDGYEVEEFDITYRSLLPDSLERLYGYVDGIMENLPYVGLLFSIGLANWLSVFMLGMCTVRERRREKLLFFPVLAVTLGLLIGTPVFAEFRYAYTTITALPLLCVVPFCGYEDADGGEMVDEAE